MKLVEEVSDKLLEVLEIMKDGIKVYKPENEEGIERLDKIKDYIEQTKD